MRGKITFIPGIIVAAALTLASAGLSIRTVTAQSQITAPEKFFGFQLGADRKMARWD